MVILMSDMTFDFIVVALLLFILVIGCVILAGKTDKISDEQWEEYCKMCEGEDDGGAQ